MDITVPISVWGICCNMDTIWAGDKHAAVWSKSTHLNRWHVAI